MAVDPRTPVLVGVGQFTERIDDPSYRGMSAVDLATAAAQAALTDTGADVRRRGAGDRGVRRLRQFEICTPFRSQRWAARTTTCARWHSASGPTRRARCWSPSAATARRSS